MAKKLMSESVSQLLYSSDNCELQFRLRLWMRIQVLYQAVLTRHSLSRQCQTHLREERRERQKQRRKHRNGKERKYGRKGVVEDRITQKERIQTNKPQERKKK